MGKTTCTVDFEQISNVFLMTAEAYLEPYQTSKMESSTKIINGKKTLTIFAKHSTLDI